MDRQFSLKRQYYSAGVAVIRSRGRIVERIKLGSEDKTYEIEGPLGISLVKVTGEKVQMLSSPCQDKICVRQGFTSESGQSIVCVPNEISITIEKKGEIDEITR